MVETDLESEIREAYRSFRAKQEEGALSSLRDAAFQRFSQRGFPAARDEAWKYTNIRRILERPFEFGFEASPSSPSDDEVGRSSIAGLDASRIVLCDGELVEDLSDVPPEGVQISRIQEDIDDEATREHFGRYLGEDHDSFSALNTAFAGAGLSIRAERPGKIARPIHIVHLTSADDRFVQTRVLVVLKEGAELTVLETHHAGGSGRVFHNSVVEAFVGPGATLDYYRLQDAGKDASAVSNAYFYQEESSTATCTTVTLSGDTIRNNVVMHPDGEHCESHLFGLFVAKDSLHVDNHTLVDHAKPNCDSNELYKGVLDDSATGVFNGRVLVRRDAQNTNAYQSSKSIVLSENASMNAKPELEIYADDVKCSHGATTGRLDAEAMFYLRSRGLTEAQSRNILLMAFAADVLENVSLEALRDHIGHLLAERMSAVAESNE